MLNPGATIGKAFFIDSNAATPVQVEMLAALDSIKQEFVSCTLDLPNQDIFDPEKGFYGGWGIVGGLQVSLGSGEIVVTPGLAMDCVGNEIEIDQPTRLPVSGTGRICYVTLAFVEREVELAATESLAESRVEEGGELALAPADPAIAHPAGVRRSDPCGRLHPIAIGRLVRLGSRWRRDPFFRPGRARSWRALRPACGLARSPASG